MKRRESRDADQHAALEAYRAAAHAEADAAFGEAALEAQRARILDRLAHAGQPAKVIPFPAAAGPLQPAAGINRRWVTAAAAAGLIIGLVGGQFVHVMSPGRQARRAEPVPTSEPARGERTFAPTQTAFAEDDGLLGEVDSAVQLRSAAALRTLDELTPFREPR